MALPSTDLGANMRFEPEDLGSDELAFRFETNDIISAAAIGTFLFELERIARLKSHFGPDARVQVLALGTGSLWGKLKVAGAVAVGAAALGDFGLALEERISRPRANIAQCVAEMTIDSGVVSATITTQDCQITVNTQGLPAIESVQQKRQDLSARNFEDVRQYQERAINVAEGTKPIAGTAPQLYGGRAYGEGSLVV
jgi:propanediol dehydratase small subunit